ncbi:MAG TPA: putative glycoside hydrolase, partial [Candidatus Saccharimonadales bacterium]|nr:putative glycoside hydrolase [Candidatus Saccharimonadales bacterium]
MALGTHKSYRIEGDHQVDVVIVSPERREKAVLKMARAAYPDAKVFAYLNTMDVMLLRSPERPAFWKEHEDWFLHDADGERIRVRVKHYSGPMSRYGMNVAKAGWQEYLGRRAAELLGMGYDGVQLDNVETDCSYKLRNVGRWISALPVEMTPEIWYRAEAEMLARIRKMATEAGYADREIIFNHIRAGEPQRSLEYLAQVDGANSENWLSMKADPRGTWGWAGRMNLARQAAAGGKRINLLAQAALFSPEEALFTFSSYLLASGGDKTAFWYGKAYRAEEMRWFWFYDVDLGAASGPMHPEGNDGVFRRDFDKGAVLVNPETEPRTVDTGGTFLDDAFEPVQRVTLGPRRGAILLKPGGAPPPREVLQ